MSESIEIGMLRELPTYSCTVLVVGKYKTDMEKPKLSILAKRGPHEELIYLE